MIGYRHGTMVTLCDHCAKPVPDDEVVQATIGGVRLSFCGPEHAACYSPLPYRCPDCVMAGTDPCAHREEWAKRPDRAGDPKEPVG